jgi:hypothetical protein
MDQPATVKKERPPRASMRGATKLLRDILDDLETLAATRAAAAPGAQSGAKDRGPTATLGDVIDRLDERAFGLLLLLLGLPCAVPFVYVLPQIISLPILALAAQMALGRKTPWLPDRFRRRTFPIRAFKDVIDKSERYVGWVERFAHPRLRPVTGHGGARFVGAILLIPAFSILVPLPGTNAVPGMGISVAALGLIERDGILVILGLLIGVGWVVLLLVLGLEAVDIIKSWLQATF